MEIVTVRVPRIGVNDDFVTIGEWFVKDGEKVDAGQLIVSLETTKETVEIEAGQSGYLFYRAEVGDELLVDSELAIISENADFRFEDDGVDGNLVYTASTKAEKLIAKHHIDVSQIDMSHVILERDVLKLLGRGEEAASRPRTNDIIIIGGGGMAKMCIELINKSMAYNIAGILDPNVKKGTEIMGVPVLGGDDMLPELRRNGCFCAINAIGSITSDQQEKVFYLRRRLCTIIKENGFFMPTLIHPSAQVAESARIGEGCIVMENTVIGPAAVIGDDVIINTGAIISHDCRIGSHARISPGAILAGDVTVGDNSLIGMGVTVYIGIHIGQDVIISNGKNVFSDIESEKKIV